MYLDNSNAETRRNKTDFRAISAQHGGEITIQHSKRFSLRSSSGHQGPMRDIAVRQFRWYINQEGRGWQ